MCLFGENYSQRDPLLDFVMPASHYLISEGSSARRYKEITISIWVQ